MTHQDIPGWFDFESAYLDAVDHFPDGSTFIEVGCYLGRSLCCLGEMVQRSGKNIRVIGVDTCTGSGIEGNKDNHGEMVRLGGGTMAGLLHRNVVETGNADTVELLISRSERASTLFNDKSLAFVYLDAAHDRTSVERDIRAWLPKIANGGWLGGDDLSPVWPGVEEAVRTVFGGGWEKWSHDSWRIMKML